MAAVPLPLPPEVPAVLRLRDIDETDVVALLARYGLRFERIADGAPIPGSFWGDTEAGIIASTVFARGDTPLHSLLHEACHLIVIPPTLRWRVRSMPTSWGSTPPGRMRRPTPPTLAVPIPVRCCGRSWCRSR